MAFIIIIIAFALIFDFLNGFHDSANSIATIVATRVLKPQQAVLMAAFANLIAAFVFSTAVAQVIGKGIVQPNSINSTTIFAGLIGASIWNLITWYLGLPISSSHALIGGLIGATLITSGVSGIITSGVAKVIIFIFIAPLIGFLGAIIFTFIILSFTHKKPRSSMNPLFSKIQIVSSFFYSLGHGTNDAQKTMGIISLTLFTNGLLGKKFMIPVWVILASHLAIALGTYFGGWRIVKTMGTKLVHLRPFEGFCAETSSAVTLLFTSHFGIPVSTTHVISGSIIGVGTSRNYKKVRWITTRKILTAWLFTIPVAIVFGAFFCLLFPR